MVVVFVVVSDMFRIVFVLRWFLLGVLFKLIMIWLRSNCFFVLSLDKVLKILLFMLFIVCCMFFLLYLLFLLCSLMVLCVLVDVLEGMVVWLIELFFSIMLILMVGFLWLLKIWCVIMLRMVVIFFFFFFIGFLYESEN